MSGTKRDQSPATSTRIIQRPPTFAQWACATPTSAKTMRHDTMQR